MYWHMLVPKLNIYNERNLHIIASTTIVIKHQRSERKSVVIQTD